MNMYTCIHMNTHFLYVLFTNLSQVIHLLMLDTKYTNNS